jgi:TonB family protein
MINYFIKFATIHLVLFVAYKLLLSNETNLKLRRFYLLGMTFLALCLPLIDIPVQTKNTFNISSSVTTYVLPEISGLANTAQANTSFTIAWYELLFLAIMLLLALRFVIGLVRILIIYAKSSPYYYFSSKLRHVTGIAAIFTFFQWIFIDKEEIDEAGSIIKHEQAHVKYGHSYDLIFLNVLTIPFWWLPTHWWLIKEIKQVHEYQADAYALNGLSRSDYSKTLINYSLLNQGLALTNSFNDTTLTKRLNYMKKLKKKVSLWKLASLGILAMLTVYAISCQEKNIDELSQEADAHFTTGEIYDKADVMPTYPGGIEAYYKYLQENLKYSDEAMDAGISGKVFVEMVVNKDGSISNVKALKGVGYGLNEEAIRVVSASPVWISGKLDQEKVRVKLLIPISFMHPDDTQPTSTKSSQQAKEIPTFPGGKDALISTIQENLKYPEAARMDGLEGKVFVEFMVDSDGAVKNATIKRGVNDILDSEAIRVIESLPNWIPPVIEGKAVATTMVIPINFIL